MQKIKPFILFLGPAIFFALQAIGPSETIPTEAFSILSATIWLADMNEFADMNAIWDMWVAKGNPPVRACVESKLAAPQYKVEIQVTAVKE